MNQSTQNTTGELEYLQHMFMQVPAMIAVFHGPEHILDLANPTFMKAAGQRRRLVGKRIRSALPELSGQHIFEMLDSVFATGKTQTIKAFPVRFNRSGKNGPVQLFLDIMCQPIKTQGNIAGIFMHAVDVTEQVTARHDLEKLAAELETVFESLPEGLLIADQQGIRRVNGRAAELLGYKSPSQVPMQLSKVFKDVDVRYFDSGEPVPNERAALSQALNGRRVQYECIVTQHNTGRMSVLRVASAPIKDARGRVIAAVAITSDITERTRLEAKVHRHNVRQKLLNQKTAMLRQQNSELKELNRSKDEFIALASHQLRTPATGVKQYIGMLIEGYVGLLEPAQKQFLEKAYESNERQLSTINDLLQIAQIDANKIVLNKTHCHIGELVDAIVQEQQSNIKRRRQVIVVNKLDGDLLALVDVPRLRMALDNIFDNASKYSPGGTTITISLSKKDAQLFVKITDQGVGIAETDFAKLFQKFSRIDNPLSITVGGNGLGLYLAKRIIDAHDGLIHVTSVLHKGTTFTVIIPVS